MLGWQQLGELATTCYQPLLLTSTMSLKLQRKSAPRMGKATGASRKLQVNFLVRVCTVHVWRPQHLSGVLSAVMRWGPVGAAADL